MHKPCDGAYLADAGIHSVDRCNLYLTPLKPSGNEKTLPAYKLDDFEIIPDTPGKGSNNRSPGRRYQPSKRT